MSRRRGNRLNRLSAEGNIPTADGSDQLAIALASHSLANAARRGDRVPIDPALAFTAESDYNQGGSLAGLTPEKLAVALNAFYEGTFCDIARIWHVFQRRDDACCIGVDKRKRKLTRALRTWEVVTFDDSPAAEEQADWLRAFYRRLRARNAIDPVEVGGLRKAAEFCVDAIAKQYAFLAKNWSGAGEDLALTLSWVPLWFFARYRGEYRFSPLAQAGVGGTPIDTDQWLMACAGEAAMEPCSVTCLLKRLPMQQIANILATWGRPLVYGKSQHPKDSPGWLAVQSAVASILAGLPGVLSGNDTIEQIAAKLETQNLHTPWIDRCDRAITTIWLHSHLGTKAEADTGSLAGGAQENDTDDLTGDDCEWITELWREQIDRPALRYGLGVEEPLCGFQVAQPQAADDAADIDIIERAVGLGVEYPVSALRERFGLPEPDGDEPLLTPRQLPAPGPGEDETAERAGGPLRTSPGKRVSAAGNTRAGNGRPVARPRTRGGATSFGSAEGHRPSAGVAGAAPRTCIGNADGVQAPGTVAARALPAAWSQPLADWLNGVLAIAQDGGTAEPDLPGQIRRQLDDLPNVLARMDHAALADAMAEDMLAAVIAETGGNAGTAEKAGGPLRTSPGSMVSAAGNTSVGNGSPDLPRLAAANQIGSAEGRRPSAAGRGAAQAPIANAEIMLSTGPNRDAVEKLMAKVPVASPLRTAEWAAVPVALRERAQFSAGVESVRIVSEIQDKLTKALTQAHDGTFMDRDRFIAEMRDVAAAEGFPVSDKGGFGALTDITSVKRLGLIWDVQTQQAAGFVQWKSGQDPDILDAFPAQELLRVEDRQVPRDWQARWVAAGGRLVDGGRMIALKTDPLWAQLSRFGTPWTPFDFGSGMGVLDVDRGEAEAFGLLTPATIVAPAPAAAQDFNADVEAAVPEGMDPRLVEWLVGALGQQIERVGARLLRWRPRRAIGNAYDPSQPRDDELRDDAEHWLSRKLGAAS